DPNELRNHGITASDVVGAIRQQNVQVAGGRIGAAPAPGGTANEFTVMVEGRLKDPVAFENIVVKTSESGGMLRVKDVGRVEEGSDLYNFSAELNDSPTCAIAIYQIPGSNIIAVADGVISKLDELEANFPDDVEMTIVYDSTEIVRASIRNVITTLISALILVILTVYVFLQNFRATIIPAITIPVALIGTFAVLLLFGFSLNQLTLFGLVLVIGIVVDDAIVVVENTTRWIDEGYPPREAAEKAMLEVSGPVIATTLVLLAVFVPTLAMPGITGTLFQQFAATISIATVFSSINALTLSPALCAILLRKNEKEPRGPFRLFNKALETSTNAYLGVTKLAIRRAFISVILFLGLAAVALIGLGKLPGGFVPQEDEGYCIISVQLQDGATLERTKGMLSELSSVIKSVDGTNSYLSISGYSLIDGSAASNAGFIVATFDDWSERPSKDLHQSTILQKLNRKLSQFKGAQAFAIAMPSLPGVGVSGGFTFMLQDKGAGSETLKNVADELIADGNAQTGLQGLNTTFRASVPQLFVDIDREQVMRTGTTMQSVFDTLGVFLGSAYVNDYTRDNRIYKVMAQADAEFRDTPESIRNLQLRSGSGGMMPLGAIAEVKQTFGPQSITRFQLYPSIKILGGAAPGFSSGQSLEIMEEMAAEKLASSLGYSWSELSYQEKDAAEGGGTTLIYAFAILMVYLVLAAQYESWTIPISVVLSVPTALLGAVLAVSLRAYDNNVYTQIGIVLLIGLSTKSAILIVEFAKVQREEGKSIFDAAVDATRLRFRAVLMTAFSFILGVIPLLVSKGAGAESQKVIGTAVFGGMLVATLVSLAAVPMLYYVVQSLSEKFGAESPPQVPVKEGDSGVDKGAV
ncbi:MAG: efflux RND transporter permease subunit, partial [Verrucomicrobiales bacterium]